MPTQRAERAAATRNAIVDAAIASYGTAGPAAVSLRDLAHQAGVTHPLIIQHFGSKEGLLDDVGDRLVAHLNASLDAIASCDADGLERWLRTARDAPSMTKLLVRAGLGDLSPADFPLWLRRLGASATGQAARRGRARICRYAAASLVLGWLTFDRFMVAAGRLGNLSSARRDRAIASLAAHLWTLAEGTGPPLALGEVARAAPPDPPEDLPTSTRDTLLAAAIELIAQRGPAAVSIREVAAHAGLNHGLLHRHFGSKDSLIAEAIDVGIGSLLPGALAPEGFDIDQVVRVIHDDPIPTRLIARMVVDDIDITSVRNRFPVMRSLLEVARSQPASARPAAAADPRVATAAAAAMAAGSAIWGSALQGAWGTHDGITVPIADLTRYLLGVTRA